MSGIAAVLHLDGSNVIRSDIERMATVLRPYGPDRQKILLRKSAAFVSCLHRFTPEDSFEQQPLLFADRLVFLFDGRIDNRLELSEAIGIQTSELATLPDSVIALRLFERWGERSFERILGDFAIVVMDLREGQLICARDPMGLRVLHYHRSADRFAVATAPEALFALSWVPRILNRDAVGDTLVKRGLDGETTYYQGINRVLPGRFVQLRAAGFSKHQFWDPQKIASISFKRDSDYVEAFIECFDNAVKARLRSCKTPCSTITGGLDSSSVAVTAADMLAENGEKLNTFTAVPESGFIREDLRGCYFDETPYVRQLAKSNTNLVTHFVPPSNSPILNQIAEEIRIGGGPYGGILNGLWVMDIYTKAQASGHDVMLTGEAGNITMSYDGRGLFAELLRKGRLARLFSEIYYSGYKWHKMVRQRTVGPFIPHSIFRIYKQWRRGSAPPWYSYSLINPQFAARSGTIDRAKMEHAQFDTPANHDNKAERANDLRGYNDMADWFAKLRAHYGIDTRTPAFDKQVVEFCFGIPEEQYLHKGCDRWLIRRAMEGRLPDTVLYKKKYGAQAVDWYPRLTRERAAIVEKVKRLKGNNEVASVIDLQRVAALLDQWPDHQPSEYAPERDPLLAIPQALGAAYFIEQVTGHNYKG